MSADGTTATTAARLAAWRDAATAGALPLPTRGDRWQPLRAGLVNLWEYDIAEVWYGDGRLQLQGANESGKSTLMTLTTLLLLTGDISGHNIDTLGDSGKRFWYHVEPTDHPLDRRDPSAAKHRGWAWAEYGRQGENGPEFFTTLLFAVARSCNGAPSMEGRGRDRRGYARGSRWSAPDWLPSQANSTPCRGSSYTRPARSTATRSRGRCSPPTPPGSTS
jgi:hypothetical protein